MSKPTHDAAVVRILTDDQSPRNPKGAGFLVTPQHVLTCAHVVNDALGRKQESIDQPNFTIFLDFPLLPSCPLVQATVKGWLPMKEKVIFGEQEDIALLELLSNTPLPAGVHPAPIVTLYPYEFDEKVRIFGFPGIALDGKWVDGILKRPTGKGWIQINHEDSSGSIKPGFSGAAIWSIRKNAVCGMTVSMLNSTASYMIPADTLLQACPEIDQLRISSNPYKGLQAFQEEDACFFFGREKTVARLQRTVEEQSFTAVIGASGSGKSSLVFAGLLPILRQSRQWEVVTCRPQNRAFCELAGSLTDKNIKGEARYEEVTRIKKILTDGSNPYRLYDLIRYRNPDKIYDHFLLVIDQFEELYTLNNDNGETSRRFMNCLLGSIQSEKFHILVTMQGNFHDNLDNDISLKTYPPFRIGEFDRKGLREAIERPAKRNHVIFEDGLTDTIIQELGDEPGNLPLLQFCLTQLWERQKYGWISWDAYRNIGRVQQALIKHADSTYKNICIEYENAWIKQIFLNLIYPKILPGRGIVYTRKARLIEEFRKEHKKLLNELTKKRLLVTLNDDAGKKIEIIHEALIRHWQPLQSWINKTHDFLIWREDLKNSIDEWHKRNKDKGILLNEKMLNNAFEMMSEHKEYLLPHEQKFIYASKQTIKERKYILRAVVIAFVVPWPIILGLLADPQQKNPFKKTEEATTSTSSSMGQYMASYKEPLNFASTKIFFDTKVLQDKLNNSTSSRDQKLVHDIFFISENKQYPRSDLKYNTFPGQKFEATTPLLQDCRATPLYRTFMEGLIFCQQVEKGDREVVYADLTPADQKKYGSLLDPPPPGQSKFDQVLEWAQAQQKNAQESP
nr:serine protease [Candidatus Electrothrix aestuarii]